jgi:hypothetical protein
MKPAVHAEERSLRYQLSRPVAAGVYHRREEIERARDGEEREEEPSSFSDSLFRNAIILSSIQTHA